MKPAQRFPNHDDLTYHEWHVHSELRRGTEMVFTREHCGREHVRKDAWQAHAVQCEKNLALPPRKKAKARPRCSLQSTQANAIENQPPPPDNGRRPYLVLEPKDAKDLPHVDPVSPIIYRGELYCRYPGCTSTHRYAEAYKLRCHYTDSHGMTYKEFTKGKLTKYGTGQHENGVDWPSRSCGGR